MSHPFQTIEACSLMDPLPRSVVSLLHGEVRPTCSANGQKVAIIGMLTLAPTQETFRHKVTVSEEKGNITFRFSSKNP